MFLFIVFKVIEFDIFWKNWNIKMNKLWEENDEIKRFREYLRIPSVHPNINYGEFHIKFIICINFLLFYHFTINM